MGSDGAAQAPANTHDEAAAGFELVLTRSPRLRVFNTPDKGRGVFAAEAIPADTLIEVSPALIVPREEYARNDLRTTIFESYLFTWSRSGDYALALGLGSLFNHSDSHPNVSYVLDKTNTCIRYTSKRLIKENEELCIFYGHGVRFGAKGELLVESHTASDDEMDPTKALGGLCEDEEEGEDSIRGKDDVESQQLEAAAVEDEQALVEDNALPLEYITAILAPEDIPLELIDAFCLRYHPRQSAHIIKFLQANELHQLHSMRHLRKIRRINDETAEAIVCPASHLSREDLCTAISLSEDLQNLPELPIPIVVRLPANPARTTTQAQEWSKAHWPVSLIPVKADVMAKTRAESFSQGKVDWIKTMCLEVLRRAKEAKSVGELPIACLAAESWVPKVHSLRSSKQLPVMLAARHDSRQSSKHPLGHAAMNLIAHVAELDKTHTRPAMPAMDVNYLLTGLTVFMTHEPCLLCSMALLHSRIATLVYIRSSPGAGGCGTEYSLHEQQGTNHHFDVWRVSPKGEWGGMLSQVEIVHADP